MALLGSAHLALGTLAKVGKVFVAFAKSPKDPPPRLNTRVITQPLVPLARARGFYFRRDFPKRSAPA